MQAIDSLGDLVLLFRNTVSIVWARPFVDPVGADVPAGPFKDHARSVVLPDKEPLSLLAATDESATVYTNWTT
jgi:hypothetical protein